MADLPLRSGLVAVTPAPASTKGTQRVPMGTVRRMMSGTFEFNLQAGTGIMWFLKDNLALSLEARYVHWSCAGFHQPNSGLNGLTGLLGITYFF